MELAENLDEFWFGAKEISRVSETKFTQVINKLNSLSSKQRVRALNEMLTFFTASQQKF